MLVYKISQFKSIPNLPHLQTLFCQYLAFYKLIFSLGSRHAESAGPHQIKEVKQ